VVAACCPGLLEVGSTGKISATSASVQIGAESKNFPCMKPAEPADASGDNQKACTKNEVPFEHVKVKFDDAHSV
jgi:hypothetical protein